MQQVFDKTESKMNKTINALNEQYAGIRAGRASASVLNRVMVDYYGVPTPVTQLANVSSPEPRLLKIAPYDKTALKDIERAILTSDIGINPQNDGTIIRLNFPPLTEEHRKELCKNISKYAEEAKVAVRSIRRDAIESLKTMKKNAEITEDDQANGEKKVQTITDDFCKQIDEMAKAKEKDILEL
ncbi:MAG: ribosome recycling factor [Clostridia bacterium]|nr:ribosome recycling factor [Clostridia bacterium]